MNTPKEENNLKKEKDLKSSNNEKSTINPIWVIISWGLLALLFYLSFYWNSLDYEVQGNLFMAGMVFLIPVGALLILAAFVWGWMALMSLLIKVDKNFDDKSKVDGPSQPDPEVDVKDKNG